MVSYVITGVSKGIGFEFLTQLSADPKNTVIGVIRNKAPTAEKVAKELPDRKNIHLLEADITNYKSLNQAAESASKILNGKLDVLIANAALVPEFDAFGGVKAIASKPEELSREFKLVLETNVLGNIHLYNAFTPLILAGNVKKVVVISSGLADEELTVKYALDNAPLYSTSKAAMNMITAKYHAEYRDEGVLFMGLSPGFVDVGKNDNFTPEQLQAVGKMAARFTEYAPHFKGAITPQESVTAMLKVVENSTVEKDGGAFLSHKGNKEWL